jgi:hypothetical protein
LGQSIKGYQCLSRFDDLGLVLAKAVHIADDFDDLYKVNIISQTYSTLCLDLSKFVSDSLLIHLPTSGQHVLILLGVCALFVRSPT